MQLLPCTVGGLSAIALRRPDSTYRHSGRTTSDKSVIVFTAFFVQFIGNYTFQLNNSGCNYNLDESD